MRSNICLLLALGLAVAQAVPASRIEKKSMEEASDPLASDLKLEETGDDKDRPKKSLCMGINDNNLGQVASAVQMVPVQTVNMVPQVQQSVAVATPIAQSLPTMQFVQQPQVYQQQTSYSIVAPQVQSEVVETVPVSVPAPIPVQQSIEVVQSRPVAQALPTMQFVQQPQVYQQPTSYSIVAPQVQTEVTEVVAAPVPAPIPVQQSIEVIQARPMVQSLPTVQVVQQPTSYSIVAPQVQTQMTEVIAAPAPAPIPVQQSIEVVQARPMVQALPTVQMVQQPTSYSIVAPQVQTEMTEVIAAPVPAPIPVQQSIEVVQARPMVQSLPTVQVVQQPQPCQQATSFSIVAPQVQTEVTEVVAAPAPVEMVPVQPVYKEDVMVVPQQLATVVNVPQCVHARRGVQCNCGQQGLDYFTSGLSAHIISGRDVANQKDE